MSRYPSGMEKGDGGSMVRERMLEAGKKQLSAAEFILQFERSSWAWVSIYIHSNVWDHAVQTRLSHYVAVYERAGLTPASKHPHVLDFREQLSKALLSSLRGNDAISAMASYLTLEVDGKQGRSYRAQNPDNLLVHFGRAGFGVITGPPQKGKTNTACVLMERWLASSPGRRAVITNVRIRDPPDLVLFADSLSGLLRFLVGKRQGADWDPGLVALNMQWLWVLDEGGRNWQRARATSTKSMSFETLVRILGKHDGNMLYLEQLAEGVPTTMASFGECTALRCLNRGVVRIDIAPHPKLPRPWNSHGLHDTWYDFAKTGLRYDPDDYAPFQVDLNMDNLISALAGEANQIAAIRKYLDRGGDKQDSPGKSPLLKPLDIEAVAEAREARMTWAQIALATGVSQRTLRDRYEEWLERQKKDEAEGEPEEGNA